MKLLRIPGAGYASLDAYRDGMTPSGTIYVRTRLAGPARFNLGRMACRSAKAIHTMMRGDDDVLEESALSRFPPAVLRQDRPVQRFHDAYGDRLPKLDVYTKPDNPWGRDTVGW